MIEIGTVDGMKATLSYVDADMVPVDDKDDAVMISAWLEDGRHLFLFVPGKEATDDEEITQTDWLDSFSDIYDAGRWDENKHPRGQPENAGQFGPGGGGTDKKTKRAVASAAGLVKRARSAGRSVAEQHRYETSQRAPQPAAKARAKKPSEEALNESLSRIKREVEAGAEEGKSKKKQAKIEDFEKAKIRIGVSESQHEGFLRVWNERIGMDPEEFKKAFVGGVPTTMVVTPVGPTRIDINGTLMSEDGRRTLGTYDREIDFDNQKAYSAYFKVEKTEQDADIGKKVLAGNVAMYEKLGITEVGVTANIDVGGYAWAKYGYVPTQEAWNQTRQRLASTMAGSGVSGAARSTRGENTMEADDWSMLDEVAQNDVRDRWMRDSRDEFYNSEIDSWRESGQALEDAKRQLAHDYIRGSFTPDWVNDGLNELREERVAEGLPPIPYSNQQIYAALEMEPYESSSGEGRDDPTYEWNDEKLQKPDPKISGYDPDQKTLPGIEPLNPASFMTKEMRENISDHVTFAFNSKSDNDAQHMDAPDYINDNVSEYQESYWDDMEDRERLRIAERYDMNHVEIPEDEDEQEEMELPRDEYAGMSPEMRARMEREDIEAGITKPKPKPKEGEKPRRTLEEIVKDSNPKAMWEFADTPGGKDLLLKLSKAGYGWRGKLNLKDPESYARFKEYVGRVKEKKRAA